MKSKGFHFSLLDAARDYMRIGFARLYSPEFASLFIGDKGEQLDHVAPHLFQCDANAMIAHLTVAGLTPGEVGVLIDTSAAFVDLRQHLRRFLTVIRERDRKRVFFRYYDPRVLRVFLPVCTPSEVRQFFGPIEAFHCQAEKPGTVFSFTHRDGFLEIQATSVAEFFHARYGIPTEAITELMQQIVPAASGVGFAAGK